MLEEGRECEDVATQLAAVSKAIDHAGFQLLISGLKQCQTGESESIDTTRLEKLFLAFA
jgi:DNA-binding FrmR family transcriptional regulator